jgi:hypothetical protein
MPRRPSAGAPPARRRTALPAARTVLAAAALVLAAPRAGAQGNAFSVTARANVTEAISVTALSAAPMAFGTVYPGVDAVLPWTAAGAGGFEGRYKKSASVDLVFTFAALSNGTGGSLVIEGVDGCWIDGNGAKPASCPAGQSFVPTASRTNVPINSNSGRFRFWIGARVRPTAAQPPGSYTGTIEVTALSPST